MSRFTLLATALLVAALGLVVPGEANAGEWLFGLHWQRAGTPLVPVVPATVPATGVITQYHTGMVQASPAYYVPPAVQATYPVTVPSDAGPAISRSSATLARIDTLIPGTPGAVLPMSNAELTAHVEAMAKTVEKLANVSATHHEALKALAGKSQP